MEERFLMRRVTTALAVASLSLSALLGMAGNSAAATAGFPTPAGTPFMIKAWVPDGGNMLCANQERTVDHGGIVYFRECDASARTQWFTQPSVGAKGLGAVRGDGNSCLFAFLTMGWADKGEDQCRDGRLAQRFRQGSDGRVYSGTNQVWTLRKNTLGDPATAPWEFDLTPVGQPGMSFTFVTRDDLD